MERAYIPEINHKLLAIVKDSSCVVSRYAKRRGRAHVFWSRSQQPPPSSELRIPALMISLRKKIIYSIFKIFFVDKKVDLLLTPQS